MNDTTTVPRHNGGEGLVMDSGPKRRAQVCFFSVRYLFLLTIIFYLYVIRPTDPQTPHIHTDPTLAPYASRWGLFPPTQPTRPTLAANASRWTVSARHQTHGPHPRSKRESVRLFFTHTVHTAHPRCKRESVGRCHTTTPSPDPTLAPNASRWGFY